MAMAMSDELLDRTLKAMQNPAMKGAHVRHVPAIDRLVRLQVSAAAGFSLSQVGRVAAIMNMAAESLDRGALDYADVLSELCALCAVPFSRASVHDDHFFLHEVSELLSAIGSLLGNQVDKVAYAVRALLRS